MKKSISLLLILCLLLSGCSTHKNDAALKISPTGIGRTMPSETDYGSQNPDNRFASENRGSLWENYFYYECDPYGNDPWQPKVYRTALGSPETPELVFNGEIIGIYAGILITCDDEAYYALPLKKGGKWIKLQPAGCSTAYFEYSGKLLIFGYNDEGNYVDTLELETLNSVREPIDITLRDFILEDNILYCLGMAENTGYFYQADLAAKTGKQLCETGRRIALDKAGDRVLFRHENRDPLVYDLMTGEAFVPKEFEPPFCCGVNPSLGSVRNGIAIIGYDEGAEHYTWYYDIATGRELAEAPAESGVFPLSNGSYTLDERGEFTFTVDGETYTSRRLPDGVMGRIYANSYGMACLSSGGLFTAERGGDFYHILHYEIIS